MMDGRHAKQEGVWIHGAPVVTMRELAAFRMRVVDAIERRSQFHGGSPRVTQDEMILALADAAVLGRRGEGGKHGHQ